MEPATTRPTPAGQRDLPWWRRAFVRPDPPVVDTRERLVADLRRLEAAAETLLADDRIVARGQRLQAVMTAYDIVLLEAARELDVPEPGRRAPLPRTERFLLRAELARAGLDW